MDKKKKKQTSLEEATTRSGWMEDYTTIEQVCFNAIVQSLEYYPQISSACRPEYFRGDCGRIMEKVARTYDEYKAVDITMIYPQCSRSEKQLLLPEQSTVVDQILADPSKLFYFIDILREAYIKHSASMLRVDSESTLGLPGKEIISRISEKAMELNAYYVKTKSITELHSQAIREITSARKNTGRVGIQTGFGFIDNNMRGLCPNRLIVIAARPGVGKTSFALNVARSISIKGDYKTCIYSLEMSGTEMLMRLYSIHNIMDYEAVQTGKLTNDQLATIEATDISRISINDNSSTHIDEVISDLYNRKRSGNLDFAIIDYVQLLSAKGANINNREQEISYITRQLKAAANQLEIPILAIAQLNRDVEKRTGDIRLSDLRESGAIEQDADIVAFLNVENQDTGEVKATVPKCRNGKRGFSYLRFDGSKQIFYNNTKIQNNEQETYYPF